MMMMMMTTVCWYFFSFIFDLQNWTKKKKKRNEIQSKTQTNRSYVFGCWAKNVWTWFQIMKRKRYISNNRMNPVLADKKRTKKDTDFRIWMIEYVAMWCCASRPISFRLISLIITYSVDCSQSYNNNKIWAVIFHHSIRSLICVANENCSPFLSQCIR